MQTVLGLVIHRFDIHIMRETGCFDVRGNGSMGTAEEAHFSLTQHGPGGRIGCTESRGGKTHALMRCNPQQPPSPALTHSSPPHTNHLIPDP